MIKAVVSGPGAFYICGRKKPCSMKRIILIGIPLVILSVIAADSILDPLRSGNLRRGTVVVPNGSEHLSGTVSPIHLVSGFRLRTSLGILDRSLDRQLETDQEEDLLAGEDMHIWLKTI